MGTSSGIFRAVDVTLSLRGKSRHRLVVRTSRCCRDNPASTSGEDAVSAGDSIVILALACSPEPRASQRRPFGFYACLYHGSSAFDARRIEHQ